MAPFPSLPMAALTMGLFSAWFVQLSMSAYVGYMVDNLGIVNDKDQAGYLTGLLSSAFMIGRLASAYFWGVTADRYGRRPVILFSLGSTSVFAVAFGVSETFLWALTCRFFLGLFNGMAVIFPTVIAEICGKEHEVLGMGLATTAWSIGLLAGAGFGGVLAEPATHYPSIFSASGIFVRFPYLLPNVVGGGLTILSIPVVLWSLPETLSSPMANGSEGVQLVHPAGGNDTHSEHLSTMSTGSINSAGTGESFIHTRPRTASEKEQRTRVESLNSRIDDDLCGCESSLLAGQEEGEADSVLGDTSKERAEPERGHGGATRAPAGSPTMQAVRSSSSMLFERRSLLGAPHVRLLLFTYGLYMFVISGLDDVYALWALSTVPKGGLDWSAKEIGQVLLFSGLMVFAFEVTVSPLLGKRASTPTSMRVVSVVLVLVYPLFPLLTHLRGTGWSLIAASVALLSTILACCDSFYTSLSLAVNNAATPDRRGQLNGLASSVASVASMVGPAIWSATFAFSVDCHHFPAALPFPIDFRFTFWVMALLRLAVAYLSWDAYKAGHDEVEVSDDEERGLGKERCDERHLPNLRPGRRDMAGAAAAETHGAHGFSGYKGEPGF